MLRRRSRWFGTRVLPSCSSTRPVNVSGTAAWAGGGLAPMRRGRRPARSRRCTPRRGRLRRSADASSPSSIAVSNFPGQSQGPLYPPEHRRRLVPLDGVQEREALLDRTDNPATVLTQTRRNLSGGWRQNRIAARPRIRQDVHGILRQVVDDDVEVEGIGDPAAGTGDDKDRRQIEAVEVQPALRLQLCGVAGGLRDGWSGRSLPIARSALAPRVPRWPRARSRQRLPEVFDRRDLAPQPLVLRSGQTSCFARCLRVKRRLGSAEDTRFSRCKAAAMSANTPSRSNPTRKLIGGW